MKLFIYSYNSFSEGAKELSRTLDVKRIKHQGSKFRGGMGKAIINWGSSSLSDQALACERILNKPEAVRNASNKLKAFELLQEHDVSIPPYYTDKEDAIAALDGQGCLVARTILNGHSGAGIVIVDSPDNLVDAPLYTQYIPKKYEYRLHVFLGEVVDVQRKARNKEIPDDQVDWKVRNHANGFIFMREGVEVGEEAKKEAINAVVALGLDFGAVDIIYNEKQGKYYVLEVNTAPGLTGATLDGYTKRIKEVFNA